MNGRLVAEGMPEEVAANPLVQERYLGTAVVGNKACQTDAYKQVLTDRQANGRSEASDA
jgi:hypothetical protein